ncbi:hypothetical protein QE152_g8806 [Popillia japonica]|uniref:Uncharacterized protein n=1 Tax=Popillia japonica TaxID=7064 RepID=A0AAW1M2B5_POPJA
MIDRQTPSCSKTYENTRSPKPHELEELLLQDDDEIQEEVVLVLPDDGDITDGDSGDEDEVNLQGTSGSYAPSECRSKIY